MPLKRIKRAAVLAFVAGAAVFGPVRAQPILANEVLRQVEKVANWQLEEFAQGRIIKLPLTEWENGALYTGIAALKTLPLADTATYSRFLYDIGQKCQWDTGPGRFFADDYCVAQMYTDLYLSYREPKMITKWKQQADSIVAAPFNGSLEISREVTLREWAWCDALFMGPPSLALLSVALEDPKYLRKADTLWWKTSDYLYSIADSLYYRDNRFFERREKNGEKVFWSRGNGWVLAGLARMMTFMPENFGRKGRYEQQFKEMAQKIASLQQPDGTWHASLYDPIAFPEKESSGTAFFCYALSWGINHGLLSKDRYLPVVQKAWQALLSCIHPDGKLGYVQNIGDKPVAAAYESTNVYGVGAFLLAGAEVYELVHHD